MKTTTLGNIFLDPTTHPATKPKVFTTHPDNPEPEHEEKFTDLGNDGSLISTTIISDEFSWNCVVE